MAEKEMESSSGAKSGGWTALLTVAAISIEPWEGNQPDCCAGDCIGKENCL
jgi:hypothetical protein